MNAKRWTSGCVFVVILLMVEQAYTAPNGTLVELMAWLSWPIHSHKRNELLDWEIRKCKAGSPYPVQEFITCSLILSVFSQKGHKARSSIVYSPGRTFGSFLDGLDPVCAACLSACQHSICLTVMLCSGATDTAIKASAFHVPSSVYKTNFSKLVYCQHIMCSNTLRGGISNL